MSLALLVATILFASIGANIMKKEDELLSVYLLYRHGDRTPLHSFPKDKYFNPTYFPMGYGQLTELGKQRHFQLGEWLRRRYSGFLPVKYSRKDIYVFATDIDRTLMSAYCCLAGLYPPTEEQTWNPELPWQPIPVHSIGNKHERIITFNRPCSRYRKLIDEMDQSEFFDSVNRNNSELYAFLTKKTGMNVTDIDQAKLIWSNVYIYKHFNQEFMRNWMRKLDTERMNYIAGLAFQRLTYSEEMQRLGIGPFFYHLFKKFNKVVNGKANTPKIIMISGHDTALASAMNSMGAFKPHPPQFAATLLWELKKRPDGSFYVNVLYKTEDGLEKLIVEGCQVDCNYEDFVEIMKPRTLDVHTWRKECTI